MFAIFVTVVSKFNSCPHCEKIYLKIIQSMGRTGLNMQKIQEPKKCVTWRILLKNSGQCNCGSSS